MARTAAAVVLWASVAALLAGCKVDANDVQRWKETVKGPTRLATLITSERYSAELRGQALLAIIEMERTDVDALAILKDALDRLYAKDRPTCELIVDRTVPRLKALLEGKPDKEANGVHPTQIRVKDAAFTLIPYTSKAARQELTRAVITWYSQDFGSRSLAGNYSAEQVTRSLGAEATSILVEALHEKMPPQAMVKIAEIIHEVGDAQAKKEASKRVVSIERAMEQEAYLTWLSSTIREAVKASGDIVDETKIASLAAYNRENYINHGALAAMQHLGDVPMVSARLLDIADTKPRTSDSADKASLLNARRANALRALEGNVREEHLDRLLSIALESANPIDVRDYAFSRVKDIGSPRAIDRLWPLVKRAGCVSSGCTAADRLTQRVRWRAGELVLSLGGPATIATFSKRLPADEGIHYEPEELEGYAIRMSQMTPRPSSKARELLKSPQWWNRVVALRYLERRGSKTDLVAVRRLTSDTEAVAGKGWALLNPPVKEVRQIAQATLDALAVRKQGQ